MPSAGPVVLVLGPAGDGHAAAVHDELARRGARPAYLDLGAFPRDCTLEWDFVGRRGALRGAAEVDLTEVRAVFWRLAETPRAPTGLRGDLRGFAERETRRALDALVGALGCPVINAPAAIAAHRHKPWQTAQVAALGVAVPDTVVTNDPAAVRRFAEGHPDGVVVKPVSGGAYARRLRPGDLSREQSIRACPMQYQALVPGIDVRAYVVGDEVLAGQIVRGGREGPAPNDVRGGREGPAPQDGDREAPLDFRLDPHHRSEKIALSPAEEAALVLIARALGLRWTGIDLRRNGSGALVFLEANPSPMFLRFAADTGHPILPRLVDLLLAAAAPP